MGYDQPRKLGDRETGGGLALPVWIDYMTVVLKGVPAEEPAAPEGVLNVGGEWYFEEYARGDGVGSLGLEDKLPVAPDEDERKGILDLFRR
jgi:penicillin-binding protein 1A